MTCPSEEQLVGYLLDTQGPDPTGIREHLKTCATCRAWMDEVRQEDKDLPQIRRVLIEKNEATAGGSSVQIGAADLTTFSPTSVVSVSPDFQEYEILQELGRGGMGAVYLAMQRSTKRKVALKVLLEGPFASASAKRRFEREVELAAQLQHPHIVTILESGISSGRYYFAMQYVEGQRLDVFLTEQKLPARQILRVFQQVCEAVSYAHQRGVIHRDLKPSNILIDDQGEPHILDFGLAKVADPTAEPELLAISVTGQLMGTLPYMSPEQAMGLHHDVDIRSDVYSLGVMLYEMLTGKYPYIVVGTIQDVLKHIVETSPRRPSSIDPRIDNDVETMVLKSLSKERERRYQSAGDLGRDLGRYLSGEAIEAKRDSTTYVLGKMLRRHRLPVAVVSLILIGILGGAFVLTAERARSKEKDAAMEARAVLARSVYQPDAVLGAIQQLSPAAHRYAGDLAERYLKSEAAPERVMGGRAGLLIRPEAFWQSVDGGPLWRSGEWLEVAVMPWGTRPDDLTPPPQLVRELLDRARVGSDRQKYVAICLLGQLKVAQAGDLFVRAAQAELQPGVAAAGIWAAGRIGRKVELPVSQSLLRDEVTGLTFAQVPGTEQFRRGSGSEDPDRYDDEDRPLSPAPIASFRLSTTEVTLAAFEEFYREFEGDKKVFGSLARGEIGNRGLKQRLADTPVEQRPRLAANWVSLTAARQYCSWLSERGRKLKPARIYQLPTEDQWEYACRGGNPGRFCYGDDADYIRFFAKCDGYVEDLSKPGQMPYVAERMPNFYGLFDMHGDEWERCDSNYGVDQKTGEPLTDARHQPLHVMRGGAWNSPGVRCRSAQRNIGTADAEGEYIGIRIVMELLP